MSEYSVKDYGNITNTKIYGLDESVVRAKYPMSVDIDSIISAEEMHYWMENDFLKRFISHQKNNRYPKYEIHDDYVSFEIIKEDGSIVKILIDEEDVPIIFNQQWHFDTYCRSNEVGLLHRYILKNELQDHEDLVVDHKNRNTTDNRKSNLRLATKSENGYNAKTRRNNSSSVMGVCWKYDKNKWKAYITIKGKQVHIGYYDNFKDAVIARLQKENNICGDFAPQRYLFDEYGIVPTQNNSVCQKTFCRLKDAIAAYENITRLGNADKGSGHDQALTGIVVQFDLTYTVKAWTEAERYTFLDFISSQSTMHRIAKFDLDNQYSEYTDPRSIAIVKELVEKYNETKDPEDYLRVLMSNPCGFKLTAGMTTNYRQLKTIYAQRKSHRLPEWREFCTWIETLPRFKELCLKEGDSDE